MPGVFSHEKGTFPCECTLLLFIVPIWRSQNEVELVRRFIKLIKCTCMLIQHTLCNCGRGGGGLCVRSIY
ncbi:hypothetical protein Sjap_022623 [Stephania japonica]|uniref:Uncharacterized protein n=1 Tax=Stephania japonica TaxID=461633 RepID=A0AAP0HUK5_9MAGN